MRPGTSDDWLYSLAFFAALATVSAVLAVGRLRQIEP